MKLSVSDPKTGGDLFLVNEEPTFDRYFFTRDKDNKYFSIIWNRGEKQTINIDGEDHDFMPRTVLPLMFNQSFTLEDPMAVTAWQFNREFYCIVDHDAEVSCVGFLFAAGDQSFVPLDEATHQKMEWLLNLFIAEFRTRDTIQREMLTVLLKRLIIDITRLARAAYIPEVKEQPEQFDLVRQFNLLVEYNFRKEHSVQFYADQLNKSPKTLANIFPKYNQKPPLQIIQHRIMLEAKRLLTYTEKTVKEITYELGFEDPAYFATFFKRVTGQSPVEFRKMKLPALEGK
jgi:AraC family transcriptional regulator, transcriptional activator of pobA